MLGLRRLGGFSALGGTGDALTHRSTLNDDAGGDTVGRHNGHPRTIGRANLEPGAAGWAADEIARDIRADGDEGSASVVENADRRSGIGIRRIKIDVVEPIRQIERGGKCRTGYERMS